MTRKDPRDYADVCARVKRQGRARTRGFVGPGATARYAAAILAGEAMRLPPPAVDVAWARAYVPKRRSP